MPDPFVEYIRRHGERFSTELLEEGGRRFFLIEKTARRWLDPRARDLAVRKGQMSAAGL